MFLVKFFKGTSKKQNQVQEQEMKEMTSIVTVSKNELTPRQDEFVDMAVKHAKAFLKKVAATKDGSSTNCQKILSLAPERTKENLMIIKGAYTNMLECIYYNKDLGSELGYGEIEKMYKDITSYLDTNQRELGAKTVNTGRAPVHAYAGLIDVTQALELEPELMIKTVALKA